MQIELIKDSNPKQFTFNLNEYYFKLFSIIISNQQTTFTYEAILTFIETLQIISFSYNDVYISYWPTNSIPTYFNSFSKYFIITSFFKGNSTSLYSIGFFLSTLTILLYTVISVIVAITSDKTLTKRKSALVLFLSNTFSFYNQILFLPLLNTLLSVFNCTNNINYYNSSMHCNGSLYLAYIVIGVLFSVILLYFTFLAYIVCYDPLYQHKNILCKQTALPDVAVLVLKCVLVLFSEIWKEKLMFIVVYVLLSIYIVMLFVSYVDYYNNKKIKLNLVMALIILCNSVCLFLSKILYTTKFNSASLLFIIESLVVVVFIFITYDNTIKNVNEKEYLRSPKRGYISIENLIRLFEESNLNNRKARILFEAYVSEHFDTCELKQCALHLMMKDIKKGKTNYHSFFLQHITIKYKRLLSKYPNNAFIICMYAYFIFSKLKQVPLGKAMLDKSKKQSVSICEAFLQYRIAMYFELNVNASKSIMNEDDNSLSYNGLLTQMKKLMLKITNNYNLFWSALFFSHQSANEDLTKINDCGTEISKLSKKVDDVYNDILKLKPNDIHSTKCYGEFLNMVLNDSDGSLKCKNKIKEIKADLIYGGNNANDSRVLNFDLKNISADDAQYLIVSTNQYYFGTIINVSLSFCAESGYTKQDLLNQHCNILIPQLFRTHHDIMLKKTHSTFITHAIDNNERQRQYKTIDTFYINKAQFLVSAQITPAIIENENGSSFFIVKIQHEDLAQKYTNAQARGVLPKTCAIITNNLYYIKHYTIETMSLLALDMVEDKRDNLFMGNYIREWGKSVLKKGLDGLNVTWCKKTTKHNVNNRLSCSDLPIVIGGKKIGRYVRMTLDKVNSITNTPMMLQSNQGVNGVCGVGSSGNMIKDDFIPVLEHKDKFMFDPNKNIYKQIKRSDDNVSSSNDGEGDDNNNTNKGGEVISFTEQIKQKALEQIHYNKTHNMSHDDDDSNADEYDNDDDDYDDEDAEDDDDDDDNSNYESSNAEEHKHSYNKSKDNESGDDINKSFFNPRTTNTIAIADSNISNNRTTHSRYTKKISGTQTPQNKSLRHGYRLSTKTNNNQNNTNHGQSRLDDVYTVTLTNIKLFVYNFQTRQLELNNDTSNYVNQVLKKIKELNDPSSANENKKTKPTQVLKSMSSNHFNTENKQLQQDKIIKQIKYSLKKNEAESMVLKLQIISYMIFFILIGFGAFILIYFNDIYNKLSENCKLIQYSYQLLRNCVYSVFLTRELTLFGMPEYQITYQETEEYKHETFEMLSSLCAESQQMADYIITTFVSISPQSEQLLFKNTLTLYMISDTLDIISFDVTLNAAISQILSAQYLLANSPQNEIRPWSKAVFFTFLNSLNALYQGLLLQADVYENEIIMNNDHNLMVTLIVVIVIGVIACLFYVIISKVYFGVVSKKDDYLAVFYEINVDLIRMSLDRCEAFTQKLTYSSHEDGSVSETVNTSEMDTTDDTISIASQFVSLNHKMSSKDSISSSGSGSINNNNTSGNSNTNSNSNASMNHSHKHKRITTKCTFEVFIIKLFLAISMSFCFIITLTIYVMSLNNFDYFENNIVVFKASSKINTEFLMLFNLLREYAFDPTQKVLYENIDTFLETELTLIYAHSIEAAGVINKCKTKLRKSFQELYDSIHHGELCSYTDDFFTTTTTANDCYNVASNATYYGLDVLRHFYVDEIKELKSMVDTNRTLMNSANVYINLTKYDKEEYWTYINALTSEQKDMYDQYRPILFFNSEKHDKLLIIFKHVLMPVVDKLTTALIDNNENKRIALKRLNNVIVIVYFCLLSVLFFTVWKHFERKVNSTIFKAKNLLIILPKQLLVGLDSIHKLFKINTQVLNDDEDDIDDEDKHVSKIKSKKKVTK